MSLTFTQYLRPNGKRVEVTIDRPEQIELLAKQLTDLGYKFEVEELNTGIVSFTVASPNVDEGDIAIKLCRNGPDVPNTVDMLVREANNKVLGYKRQRQCH